MIRFQSRKNSVVLMDNGNIQKTFSTSSACRREAEILKLLNGYHAPRLILDDCPTLQMEFIQGELLLDKYLAADEKTAKILATVVAKTANDFLRYTGKITFDENFRNYIISNSGECFRVDYEETTDGNAINYAAKIAAFAALYDVKTEIKHAFIDVLTKDFDINLTDFELEFKKELVFLSKRWGVPYPEEFFKTL